MSTRFNLSNLNGYVNAVLPGQLEINGLGGQLTIILPLIGGEDFEGGAIPLANLPEIKNRACSPREDNEMTAGC